MDDRDIFSGAIGVCIGMALIAAVTLPKLAAQDMQLTVQRNVSDQESMCRALRAIGGEPYLHASIGGLNFRTDERGAVLASYADGWFPIGDAC